MARRTAKAPAVRRRRTAEEARGAILDAAERRLIDAGPAGIRLQEVAADVGVSHPTVLHHFGSREALVEAVVSRALESIYKLVIEVISETRAGGEGAMAQVLDRIFDALGKTGHARVFFWLALSDSGQMAPDTAMEAVASAAHQVREARRAALGSPPPSLEDTRFVVVLATLALTAQSVLGPHLLASVGLDGSDRTQARFRAWIARLLVQHLESS